jgi:hypothetical protein
MIAALLLVIATAGGQASQQQAPRDLLLQRRGVDDVK